MLELKNINFEYKNNKKILDNVSFKVDDGKFLCILGHNGSGKSTLAKIIMGLIKPTNGTILYNNQIINEENICDIRKKFGIVFQNPDNQFIGLTVKDDLAFGLENRLLSKKIILEKINKYAKELNILDLLEKNPNNLSGGEKQKVAIAGILALDTELIIFDEATSMLDPKSVNELLQEIKKLKNRKTIIYITHNIEEALFADEILLLDQGKVIINDSINKIFNNINLLEEYNLKVPDTLKLISMLNNESDKEKYREVIDYLWELTYNN